LPRRLPFHASPTIPGVDLDVPAVAHSIRRGRPNLRRVLAAPLLFIAAVTFVSCVSADADAPSSGAAAPSAATAVSSDAAAVRYRSEVFSDITVDRDIAYGTAPDLEDQHPTTLTLDLYRPTDEAAVLRPAIIWVHGGGFAKGDKGDNPAAYMSTRFAKMGYVAVSMNYRLLDGPGCSAAHGIAPACFNAGVEAVHDAQTAVRWLRANAGAYGIDVDRIAIAGESAGGIVAAGVGVASDFAVEGSNPGYSSAVHAWVSISGGLPEGIFVDSGDAAGLLFAGTDDKIVPYQWSEQTAEAMEKAGVPAVLERLDGAGHVPWAEYGGLFEQRSSDFLYDHLALDGAAH
jgi:acetyl esterase/lipase